MRNELTKRIFAACMTVFLMCFAFILFAINTYLASRNIGELKDKCLYVSSVINQNGWEFLHDIRDGSSTRTTIIDQNGKVLFDSVLKPEQMENHLQREEVQEALQSGEGDSARYSPSLLRKTANYAICLNDGNIVRVSMTQDTVFVLIYHMLNHIVIIILLSVIISFVLATRFSKKIMKPINKMDVENPDDRDIYDEMKPFIRRLISQNQQIHRQMESLQAEHNKQDSMRREFTANVSHELKTPLTSISGFAEIIRDGIAQDKDIPHFADNIYKEAQRLISLVNDILKLSRMEDIDQQPEEQHTRIDLLSVCEEVEKRLAINAEKHQVTMTCEGENTAIIGLPMTVEEIIYNVCDNAIKYNRPNGWVHVTVGMENDMAVVRIKDNGIGIPFPDQERIFERFYRVNKSHSKEVGGTGLGLSIVKHGMMLHDGQITLESAPDKGTEIALHFVPAP